MGSVRSTSSATAVGSTTCVVTAPSGVSDGDLLIAYVAKSTTSTPTAPSGWEVANTSTAFKQQSQGSLMGNGCGFYWKKATGSEPADYTWTSVSSAWSIAIICFQGINYPLTNSSGVPVETALFDNSTAISRSGTTVGNTVNREPTAADFTHDHFWYLVLLGVSEAAVTHTLSALSGFLTSVVNTAEVGISMIAAYCEVSLDDLADNPEFTGGSTQCTTSSASGSARGYTVILCDPTANEIPTDPRRQTQKRTPATKAVGE